MTEQLLNFKVTDKKSFVIFLGLLREDFEQNNWQNDNLSVFLEAMERYTDDIQGYYDNTNQNINADEPSWRTFADILIGSTMYD